MKYSKLRTMLREACLRTIEECDRVTVLENELKQEKAEVQRLTTELKKFDVDCYRYGRHDYGANPHVGRRCRTCDKQYEESNWF